MRGGEPERCGAVRRAARDDRGLATVNHMNATDKWRELLWLDDCSRATATRFASRQGVGK
jgi:hypothetical protein